MIDKKILLVIFFTTLIPNAYAITEVSNQYGSLTVEQEIYEMTNNFQTNVKIYGSVTDYAKGERINITIIDPDGLTEGLHLLATKDGYFETYWIAVDDTIRGEYTILSSYVGQIIGQVQFSIQDKVYTQEELEEARSTSNPIKTSSPDEASKSLTQDETLQEEPEPITETQTATLTIKTTKNIELESTNSIYQKISNVLSNTDYFLDEPTVFPFDDGSIKTGYTIIDSDGETFGGVNIWSDNNYVKRLEIATSHFNDFDSTAIATIALAGMIKGVMDPNEYDIELFAEMFGEATSDSNYETNSIRITPSGNKVTVNYITIVEGVPGLTIMTFNIDYKQDTTTPSLEVPQNSQSNVVTPSVETAPLEKNENQEPSPDNSVTNSGNAALGAFMVFGIPAIIIGLVIFRRQRKKKLLKKPRDREWKGVVSVVSNTRPKANKESKDEMKWEGI